jgi:hypothetical protein
MLGECDMSISLKTDVAIKIFTILLISTVLCLFIFTDIDKSLIYIISSISLLLANFLLGFAKIDDDKYIMSRVGSFITTFILGGLSILIYYKYGIIVYLKFSFIFSIILTGLVIIPTTLICLFAGIFSTLILAISLFISLLYEFLILFIFNLTVDETLLYLIICRVIYNILFGFINIGLQYTMREEIKNIKENN